ncbi:MAG: hypothetical protein BWX67_02129 [Thermotogae bacterium ADurb.Bin062]|nr:MAG: hypothetical protein BWX67_02129 [Thermotogota bacterium ADurb.Bin062]
MKTIFFDLPATKERIALGIEHDKITATIILPNGTPGPTEVFPFPSKDAQEAGQDLN